MIIGFVLGSFCMAIFAVGFIVAIGKSIKTENSKTRDNMMKFNTELLVLWNKSVANSERQATALEGISQDLSQGNAKIQRI